MASIQSFSPEFGQQPKVLILGSIPGVASLQAVQYYAHPRNVFWPILCDYFKIDASLPYSERVQIVLQKGVALWDVLAQCDREGSLDSAIKSKTIVANSIEDWLASQPSVKGVICNGAKAMQSFKKSFPNVINSSSIIVLPTPSTSPAHAAMPFSEKKIRWHEALDQILLGP